MTSWLDDELEECRFADVRLGKRFRTLLEKSSQAIGETIPLACQDWASTKAAYRFFSNQKVSERDILAGHFQATRARFRVTEGWVLVLHDTTEFSFQREDPLAIGVTNKVNSGKDPAGRFRMHTVCGLLMHSSLVVTTEGLPLGLAAVKFWTRKRFKGSNALKKKINPTRVPIEEKESVRWLENLKQATTLLNEPERCVHIGDRESDIYEFFCTAQEVRTHFLVRTCVDRLVEDGTQTISQEMDAAPLKGLHRIEVRDKQGNCSEAILGIRYRRIRILPPIGKQKRYPELTLTVIYAQELGTPKDREPINWKLLTDLPVRSQAEAIQKLAWYASRWKVETYHKILKSGCKAEESRLRTADRLVNLISVFCILSWRIFWMTMLNRSASGMAAGHVFSKTERQLLDHLVPDRAVDRPRKRSLSFYITKLARLGGYLAPADDPPPGNKVMWRGLSRLTDIQLGFNAAKLVGN
ncbi:MAG TPA: IS4 family transposase [Terriglobia bacterium]|nr:IS4 family transposase [Terriglobia bacterium]